MADNFICLDIHSDKIVAVAIEHIGNTTVVNGCAQADTVHQPFAEAIDQISKEISFVGRRCRITIGAEMFFFKNIKLPFNDRKKIEQILPLELSEMVPVDIHGLLMDFVVVRSGLEGAEILAALIEKEVLANWYATLQAVGLEPDVIGISGQDIPQSVAETGEADFVLLDIGNAWATLFLVKEGRLALIRSLCRKNDDEKNNVGESDLVLFVKQTLLGYRLFDFDVAAPHFIVYLTGDDSFFGPLPSTIFGTELKRFTQPLQPLVKIVPEIHDEFRRELMERVLASGIKKAVKGRRFDFCKDDFRKKKSFHDYRRLAIRIGTPVAVAFLMVFAYFAHEYRTMLGEQEELRGQIVEVFSETLPDVSRIVNPVQQLRVVMNEIKEMYRPTGATSGRYTIIDILTEISARIPSAYVVQVNRLVTDNEAIRLKAVTGDFNTVDNIQKELGKSPYFREVTISSATQAPQGDEVSFEMKLVLAKE